MPEWLTAALAAGGGVGAHAIFQWLRARVSADARLQEHWTSTTLRLVETIQTQLHDALGELEPLRPVKAQLEEALDHLHALIEARKSENPQEVAAAERRAAAFLRRMRPDPIEKVAEERQETQRAISRKRIERDLDEGKID